jgi:hypothetical protein
MQIRPMAAGATWQNGVKQNDDGSYELPTSTPGVPARISVKERLWGLLPSRVDAVDIQGAPLKAFSDWRGGLVAQDPKTGLETVLKPSERTITVATPEVKHEIGSLHDGYRQEYHQDARQEIDAEGNVRFLAGLRGERESRIVAGPPGMVGCVPVTVQDDKTWSQIDLARGRAPVAYEMSANKKGEQARGADLSATCVDGRLALVNEDGITVSYEMFIRV